MKAKPTILLIWGYHRHNWVYPLEQLKEQFEFVYIFHNFQDEEIDDVATGKKIFWSEYRSAQHLIDEVKPDKVGFMSINSPLTMSLNSWCKHLGIPTFVLQHGLFHNFEFYLKLFSRGQSSGMGNSQMGDPRFFKMVSKFLRRSLRIWNLDLVVNQIRVQSKKRRKLELEALRQCKSRWRVADDYGIFARNATDYWSVRDGIDQDSLTELGDFEMDQYFRHSFSEPDKSNPYFVLVDNALTENNEYNAGFGVSTDDMNLFYSNVARWCESQGAKLKVKLHPYNYKSTFYESVTNVEFVKEANNFDLLGQAIGVLGFFSSLMVPALLYRPTILFDMGDGNQFQADAQQWGLAEVVPFAPDPELPQSIMEKNQDGLKEFTAKYLYKTDGLSVERLAEFLKKGLN